MLPENFAFSQHNLQDYVDCKFRFYLKYIRRMDWPAVESEPLLLHEARMELGQLFHRLVHQYFIGIDPLSLSSAIKDPELLMWWESFLNLDLKQQDGEKQAEKLVSVPMNGYRLLAKYDLLIQNSPNQFVIYDWKSGNHKPQLSQLLSRQQSHVYPFVLFSSRMQHFSQKEGLPSVEMSYWYPLFPDVTLSFSYTQEMFDEDTVYYEGLLKEILTLNSEKYDRTTDEKRCAYCRYRSYCDRGISAAYLDPATLEDVEEQEFHLDFEVL